MFPKIGLGLGLRSVHYQDVLNGQAQVDWFEVVSENYMGIEGGNGGRPIQILEKIRQNKLIVLHGVSLNIGSTDPLNMTHLKKLKDLAARIEPAWISDHFCWTGVNGENLHDLLPLPYTKEVIDHVVARIIQCQDYLGQRLVFENASSYLKFTHSEMTEWEFITEIAERADCGLLLDVNNVYVNSVNHEFDPLEFIDGIPAERIAQIHLAGHSHLGTHLVDTHDAPVCEEVWNLYSETLKRTVTAESNLFTPTMVEWDAHIPSFATLQNEIFKARTIQDTLVFEKDRTLAKLCNIAA